MANLNTPSPLLSGIGTTQYKPQTPTVSAPISQGLNLTSGNTNFQTTTPQTGGLSSSTNLNPFNSNFLTPKVAPTATGGFSFEPSHSTGFTQPAKQNLSAAPVASTGSQSPTQTGVTPPNGLDQYLNHEYTTPNGAKVTLDGSGNPTGFTPSGFSIDTSGSVPSSALGSNIGPNDIQQKHSQYMDYVNGLAQAQGYSPEYIQALQQQQQAQSQGAALQLNSAALNSNFYTGNNLPGDTLNYASGATAKAQAQNSLAQAGNSIQQLSANQQMQVQALIRSGNIAAAQALVSAAQPVSVSPGTSLVSPLNGQEQYSGLGGLTGVNALNQANSLQQQYPDAGIPSYDPSTMTPQQYQQIAMKAVASSPSFQSSTPEGQANISSLVGQQAYLDTTTRAYQTATSNLGTLQTFMQQNNLNESGVPILNQLQNKVKAGLVDPGVVSAYKSSLAGLRAEYAQVLSRGGSVTDTERQQAETLIPDNLNPSQLQTVTKQLSLEGQNAIKEAQNSVNTIKGRLTGTTSNSSGGVSSSEWPGWNP